MLTTICIYMQVYVCRTSTSCADAMQICSAHSGYTKPIMCTCAVPSCSPI